jgi:inorganic pyrophosphatase
MLKEFTHFFETYKHLKSEDGKDKYLVTIDGIDGKDKAIEAIEKSIKLYKEKFNK